MDLDTRIPPRRWLLVVAAIALLVAWDFGQRTTAGDARLVTGWGGAAAGFAIFAGLCLVALSVLEAAERIVRSRGERS